MTKLLLTALAAFAISANAMAKVWTTYVDANDASAITTAINEVMTAGDVHTVMLCKQVNAKKNGVKEVADGTCKATIGNAAMQAAGTLILKSTATDIDDLPQLYISFQTFPAVEETAGLPSLVVEGISLDDSGTTGGDGCILSHKAVDNTFGMDSCVFRRCDIKSGRAVFSEENQDGTCTSHTINHFIFQQNKCHEMNLNSSNAGCPFSFVAIPKEIKMYDNIFYDMPYAQQLINIHTTAVSNNLNPDWYIYNNTFLMSSISSDNDVTVEKKFTLVNAMDYVTTQSNFQIYNNLFLGQTAGLYYKPDNATDNEVWVPYTARPSANGNYDGNAARLVVCTKADGDPDGYITAKGNYFSKYYEDPTRYKVIETEGVKDSTVYQYDLVENNCDGMTWTDDKFEGADKSEFNVLKSDAFYTAGVSYVEDINSLKLFNIPTYVGAGIMYVDEFVSLELTDANPTISKGSYKVGKISYTRATTSGNYASFCLPFDIDLSDVTGLEKVYVPQQQMIYNTETGYLTMSLKEQDMTSEIAAGTPFLAKVNSDEVSMTNCHKVSYDADVTSNPAATAISVFNNNGEGGVAEENANITTSWGGTYVATEAVTGMNSFNVDGSFGQHTGTLNPFRAYIQQSSTSGAKVDGIIISFDENDATAIVDVMQSVGKVSPIYNISGQRVSDMKSGEIYIINGKKIKK